MRFPDSILSAAFLQSRAMKTALFSAAFIALFLTASLLAKEANWTGNYTDKKYLNGQAVFQLNILQEGGTITADFDAVYTDGHAAHPRAMGPPRSSTTTRLSSLSPTPQTTPAPAQSNERATES